MTEGLTQYIVTILLKTDANTMHSAAQSLRVGLRRPTSLYTREALVRCNSVNDYVENYFFMGSHLWIKKIPRPDGRGIRCSLNFLNYSRVEKCLMVRTI